MHRLPTWDPSAPTCPLFPWSCRLTGQQPPQSSALPDTAGEEKGLPADPPASAFLAWILLNFSSCAACTRTPLFSASAWWGGVPRKTNAQCTAAAASCGREAVHVPADGTARSTLPRRAHNCEPVMTPTVPRPHSVPLTAKRLSTCAQSLSGAGRRHVAPHLANTYLTITVGLQGSAPLAAPLGCCWCDNGSPVGLGVTVSKRPPKPWSMGYTCLFLAFSFPWLLACFK